VCATTSYWTISSRDLERNLFVLPARLGGLGISNPVHLSSSEFHASVKITLPLQSLILSQASSLVDGIRSAQMKLMSQIKHLKSSHILQYVLICLIRRLPV